MDKHYIYQPTGVCAREIQFDLIDGHVWNVKFTGGCRGNSQGVAALADGQKAEDVVKRLAGIDCRGGHSCPDELSRAIRMCLDEISAEE